MESTDDKNFLDYVTTKITSSAYQNVRVYSVFFGGVCPRGSLKTNLNLTTFAALRVA